jgi:hypothetical protein
MIKLYVTNREQTEVLSENVNLCLNDIVLIMGKHKGLCKVTVETATGKVCDLDGALIIISNT